MSINGSSGPPWNGNPTTVTFVPSGAYQGGVGEEHFLVAESNYTRNTSLPSWVDDHAMYLPFRASTPTVQSGLTTYQARTKYFTAEPNCQPLVYGEGYSLRVWTENITWEEYDDDPMWTRPFNKTHSPPEWTFWVEISDNQSHRVRCYSAPLWEKSLVSKLGILSQTTSGRSGDCRSGPVSAEISTTLTTRPNATLHEKAICRSAGALGWWRKVQPECLPDSRGASFRDRFEDANSNNTMFIACQPRINIGEATVVVNSAGVLQEPAKDHTPLPNQSAEAISHYFENGPQSLIDQSNLFFFRSLDSVYHNDTFASEYMHYFMTRAAGNLRLTDPNQPLPTFKDIEEPINKAYARLFAIWLSVNQDLLFLPADNSTAHIPGFVITLEERLIFVTPLFIISEIILGIYIVVSILIYLRRPGCYLPRMPTSIAAVIALFTSSTAIKDFQKTSHMNNQELEKHLKDLDCRYGYGSYVGSDGAVHVGIEKVPYVYYMKKVTFSGSRVEGEVRKRKDNIASGSMRTISTDYVNVPLEDVEERTNTLPMPRRDA